MVPDRPVIIDTGPLVAFLVAEDAHHGWATERFKEFPVPFLTCESVLSETLHFLKRVSGGAERFAEMLEGPLLNTAFDFSAERKSVSRLLRKYADLPTSLADACLIRMAEIHPRAVVLTLDSQFRIYRKNGRQAIPVILPPGR